ncbi:hypothetical protein ACWEQ7_37195 [Streptomyces sp. NPDC004069]
MAGLSPRALAREVEEETGRRLLGITHDRPRLKENPSPGEHLVHDVIAKALSNPPDRP